MQTRTDRINYPLIDSEALWQGEAPESGLSTPESKDSLATRIEMTDTPILVTPGKENISESGPTNGIYFRDRERRGLVTPARTPSDILLRGPLYAGSSDEDDSGSNRSSGAGTNRAVPAPELLKQSAVPTQTGSVCMETFESNFGELQGNRDHMQKQIAYHKARQEAINKSIQDFQTKMNKLLVWHKEQETELSVRLGFPVGGCGGWDSSSRSSSSGGSGRLRRGRSKLSERLYAAIDNSN